MVALAAALQAALAQGAGAAPQAVPWPRWQAHDPGSSARADHRAWGGFLARYLEVGADGINRVAYGEVTPDDREALDALCRRSGRTAGLDLRPRRADGFLDQPLQRADGSGGGRGLSGRHDPRHRHLARLLQRRAVGQAADRGRRRALVAGRHRAPHPAADLARSKGPLCGELRLARLPEPAAGAVPVGSARRAAGPCCPAVCQSPARRRHRGRPARRRQHLRVVQGRLRRHRPGRDRASAALCRAGPRSRRWQRSSLSTTTATTGVHTSGWRGLRATGIGDARHGAG